MSDLLAGLFADARRRRLTVFLCVQSIAGQESLSALHDGAVQGVNAGQVDS